MKQLITLLLLCLAFSATKAQETPTDVYGPITFWDSIRTALYKNNESEDSVLSVTVDGHIKLKFFNGGGGVGGEYEIGLNYDNTKMILYKDGFPYDSAVFPIKLLYAKPPLRITDTLVGQSLISIDGGGGGSGGGENLQTTTDIGNITTRWIEVAGITAGVGAQPAFNFNVDSSGKIKQTGFGGRIFLNTSTGDMVFSSTFTSAAAGTNPSYTTAPFTVKGNGFVSLGSNYGGGSRSGTVAYYLAVTTTGDVITTTAPGGGGGTVVKGEEFTGSTSTTLTFAHTYLTGTIGLWKNGVRLRNSDFTAAPPNQITLNVPRLSTDIFIIDYNY